MDLSWLEVDKQDAITLAMVIEVKEGVGVKIQIEGESAPRETYYNSLVIPQVGDRVYFVETGGTLLIQGSLKF